jgi:uncharacterized membrane protein
MTSESEKFDQAKQPESEKRQDFSSSDAVWTYRGYKLRSSEFNTAMVHFFRAEVQRANVWRQRLDTTTNWAVVTTGAAISIAFAQTGNQVVILLNMLLVTMFLIIEARRYRYYELWSSRVRLMETDFFAAMLVPPFQPSPDWAESLAENLLHPHFPISNWEAIGRRLRRNFLWIYTILLIAWQAKLWMQPFLARSWQEVFNRASIGPLSGTVIAIIVAVFLLFILAVSIATIGLQEAAGEVLPRFGEVTAGMTESTISKIRSFGLRAWFRPVRRRPQLMTLIITTKEAAVADTILKNMHRGVTSMKGTGMYTGADRSVLMCALTTSEIHQLRNLVSNADPKAFVIISPAQEIFGSGFMPLEDMDE